jgi:DNA-directed RNA polymerase specialized sigma24 family protein
LLGDAGRAAAVVTETLEAAIARPPAGVDAERLAVLLFQDVRRRALKLQPAPDAPKIAPAALPANAGAVVKSASAEKVSAAMHALPEPGRSALALLLLDELESDHIAKMLRLDRAEFAVALSRARLALHAALAPAEVVS